MFKQKCSNLELTRHSRRQLCLRGFFVACCSIIAAPVFFYTRRRARKSARTDGQAVSSRINDSNTANFQWSLTVQSHRPSAKFGAFKTKNAPLALAVLSLLLTGFAITLKPALSSAATANTINFQARLEASTGAIEADGNYNLEFKLYSAASGGTALWTEDYLNSASQGVGVANGYITVNLGSITAFPSTINWDQQLWLTMNVGGTTTGAVTWDGEMSPRLALTSVPYAFRAGQLAQFNATTGFTSTLGIASPTGGNQIFQIQDQGAAGTYNLCIQSSTACGFASNSADGNYIENQNSVQQASSNFWISGTGRADTLLQSPALDTATATGLSIGATNATGITIGKTGVNTTIAGNLNIGVTTSYGAITLANGAWLSAIDSTGASAINVLRVNPQNEIQVGAALNVDGGIVLPTDAGQVTLVDLPLDSTPVAGTPESYSLRVGSTNVLTVYGQADGSGNLQNGRVAVGTSISPQYTLDVGGDINTSGAYHLTNSGFNTTLNTATLSGNQTISLPNASGTICLSSSNCSGGGSNGGYIVNGTTTQTANFNIQSASASSVGAVIQGAVSQTADLLDLRNSLGTTIAKFNAIGNLTITPASGDAGLSLSSPAGAYYPQIDFSNNGGSNQGSIEGYGGGPIISPGGSGPRVWLHNNTVQVETQIAGGVGLTVTGAPSQTADLQQFQDANGNVLSKFDANGNYTGNGTNLTLSGLATPAFTTSSSGTAYYYEITATNAQGETVGSTALGMANDTSTLSWNQVPGATGYKIYRNTTNSFTTGSLLLTTITNGSTLSFTDTGSATATGLPPTAGVQPVLTVGTTSNTNDGGVTIGPGSWGGQVDFIQPNSNLNGSISASPNGSGLAINPFNSLIFNQLDGSNPITFQQTQPIHWNTYSNNSITFEGYSPYGGGAGAGETTFQDLSTGNTFAVLQYGNTPQLSLTQWQPGTAPMLIKGAPSQTADLLQTQNSSGTVLTELGASGNLTLNQGNANLTQTAAPTTAPTLTVVAGTTLGIGNYYYVVSYQTANGTTNYGPVSAVATTTSSNQAINLTAIPTGPSGIVTARKIYRTTVNGSSSGPFYLVTTLNDNTTTTYSDTTADASLGAAASDLNLAGGVLEQNSNPLVVADGTNYNTAVGLNTLTLNSTGYSNTAIGSYSLYNNTTGYWNTSSGRYALYANTSGNNNTANGVQALYSNTIGQSNTALGAHGLQDNTTGNYNVASGLQALLVNTSGSNNTASGVNALQANTTGNYNTASGLNALYSNTTGNNNTSLGFEAGYTSNSANANTTGSNNTFIGYQSGPGTTTQLQNATAIGNLAVVDSSNSLVLGSINGVNGATSSTNVGIGTATPSYRLNVVGPANIGNTSATGASVWLDNAATSTQNVITIGVAGSASAKLRTDTSGNLVLNGTSAGSVYLGFDSGTGGVIFGNGAGGQVGSVSSAGVLSVSTGYQIAGTATSGNYLRGNGTNFVSSAIQAGDIPAGSGNYIQNGTALQSSANFNISGNGEAATLTAGYASVTGGVAAFNGNVGIGTTGPTQALDVYPTTTGKGARIGTAAIGDWNAFGSSTNYAVFAHTAVVNTIGSYALLQDNTGGTYLNAATGQAVKFRINNNDKMILDQNGNVGIGTSSPGTYGNVELQQAISTGSLPQNLGIIDTTTQSVGHGGGILFGGAYNGTTTTTGAVIRAEKTNSTAGDYSFNLGFYTRNNGSTPAEVLTLANTGAALFQNSTNSTSAFVIQNAAGSTILSTDTTANQVNVNGNINLNQVTAPTTAPTVAVNTTAGNLNSIYYYVVAYGTANGITNYGPVSAAVAPVSQQVNLSAIPTSSNTLVINRKIYRTLAGATNAGPFFLVTTISDNTTTTYTDNIADGSLGAGASIDNHTANFEVSGSTVLTITGASNNTALGLNTLQSNTIGQQNTAVGWDALTNNTTGNWNSAFGQSALLSNTVGYSNVAIGQAALNLNTSGYYNDALGTAALQNNTSGFWNTAIGTNALQANTTGDYNVGIGTDALFTVTTGYSNTGIAADALLNDTTGYQNIAIGGSSLSNNSTGFQNTAVGKSALISNTTGSSNVALGYEAGDSNATGTGNVFIGNLAGFSETGSNKLYVSNSNTATPLIYGDFGTSALTINGTGVVKTATNSTSAFQVQNSSGNQVFGVDTSANQALIGKASTINGALAVYNSTNANIITIQSGITSASYTLTLPTAAATTGQCLQAGTVTGGVVPLTWGSCGSSGTHTKKVELTAEYAGAVLDSGGAANDTGTMTSGFDATQRESYYNWTTAQSTNQTYDIVAQIPVPSDFSSWASSTPITVDIKTSDTTNGTVVGTLKDTSGTTEKNWNTCALTPGTTAWTTITGCSVSGTYAANGFITLRLHIQAPQNGNTQIGNIVLSYNSAY